MYILYTTKCCILKKKIFTVARDDRNRKILPPNGNEEGLQRSDQCPIFTPGKTNVRVSNGKNVPCDNLQLLTMTGAFPDVWGHNI